MEGVIFGVGGIVVEFVRDYIVKCFGEGRPVEGEGEFEEGWGSCGIIMHGVVLNFLCTQQAFGHVVAGELLGKIEFFLAKFIIFVEIVRIKIKFCLCNLF